jgi:hypothetical protein
VLPELSRRVFLSRSLRGAAALAALPGLTPGCGPGSGTRPAPPDLQVLTPGEWRVLAAASDAFVPRGGAFPLGAEDVDLAGRIDRFVAQAEPAVVSGVRGALVVLEWAGPLLAGRLGRFSDLDAEGRTAVLAALPHRFGLARRVHAGLKQLCLFVFYTTPEAWGALGYDGPWVRRAGEPA